jgi:hypothetical protein
MHSGHLVDEQQADHAGAGHTGITSWRASHLHAAGDARLKREYIKDGGDSRLAHRIEGMTTDRQNQKVDHLPCRTLEGFAVSSLFPYLVRYLHTRLVLCQGGYCADYGLVALRLAPQSAFAMRGLLQCGT